MDSLRGSSVNIGRIQRILSWPLHKYEKDNVAHGYVYKQHRTWINTQETKSREMLRAGCWTPCAGPQRPEDGSSRGSTSSETLFFVQTCAGDTEMLPKSSNYEPDFMSHHLLESSNHRGSMLTPKHQATKLEIQSVSQIVY